MAMLPGRQQHSCPNENNAHREILQSKIGRSVGRWTSLARDSFEVERLDE
jgi:hypothetical protein